MGIRTIVWSLVHGRFRERACVCVMSANGILRPLTATSRRDVVLKSAVYGAQLTMAVGWGQKVVERTDGSDRLPVLISSWE